MTRQHRAGPTVKAPKEALTGLPATGTARLQARTVVVVLSVLLVIALVLLWPTISGKSYP
jgi:hypothetical protein